MDCPFGTQSVDWNLINIWCCGKFISCVDIPEHAQLCHALAESSHEEKICGTIGPRRRTRKTSLLKPHTEGSRLPCVLRNESTQFPQKFGKSTEMSAEEGAILNSVQGPEYWSKKNTWNEKIDDEATEETYNSSKMLCSITGAETTSSVDNLDMKDTFEETNYIKGDHCEKMYKCNLNAHKELARGYGGEKAKRKNHIKMHKGSFHDGGEKTFLCDQCNYKAKKKNHIKMHKESIHDGVTYPCDQCDYRAKWKRDLKRHTKSVHEGVTYSCDQCDYKAKWKSYVKLHKESVHENITYSCNQCDYRAKQKSNLKLHKESVHDGVIYSCDQCDYKAKWKSQLKRHKEFVHENVTYSCDHCNYKTKRRGEVKIHKEHKHSAITPPCPRKKLT